MVAVRLPTKTHLKKLIRKIHKNYLDNTIFLGYNNYRTKTNG